MLTLAKHWKVIALTAGVALFTWGVYSWGQDDSDRSWQLQWSQRDLDAAFARGKLESQHRAKERELQASLDEQQVQYAEQLAEMQSLQSDARGDADRLRGQIADLRKRLSDSSGTASDPTGVPAGVAAAMVLSDLYASCVAQRSDLAGAFDRAWLRASEVEQMYDRARGQ